MLYRNNFTHPLPYAALQAFYRRNGYKGKITEDDTCHWLIPSEQTSDQDDILAAARLENASEYSLLRGVWVEKTQQQSGLGSLLLQHTCQQIRETMIQNTTQHTVQQHCFCIAENSLVHFYAQQGFMPVQALLAPYSLQQRYQRYRRKQPELSLLQLL